MHMKKDWIWLDSFLLLLRLMLYFLGLFYFYVHSENVPSYVPLWLQCVSFLLACSLPILFYRPGYYHHLLYSLTELGITAVFGIYFNVILNLHFGSSMFIIPAFMAGYLATKPSIRWTFPVFALILPLTQYWSVANFIDFLYLLIDPPLFFGIGYCLNYILQSNRQNRKLLEENHKQYERIHEQNKALEQYAQQIERLTLIEERNRVARELHDTIGHRFTSVIMGMDAVSYLIDTVPDQAKEKLTVLREVTRKGLDEIRESIHQMAPYEMETPLSNQLDQICCEFANHTGTSIYFHKVGEPFPVTVLIRLTFVRCLQEALTNAKRHGQASRIEATLIFESEELVLQVENNGAQMEDPHAGFGLRGMSERLEQLNGSLDLKNGDPDGMTLTCKVPIRRYKHEGHQAAAGR